MLALGADQHVARHIEGEHHGQRSPARLPVQPGQRLVGIWQQVGQSGAVGWVLLHGLDQACKVGGYLFFVHFRYSFTQKITQTAENPCQYGKTKGLQIR